jgi:hypothetical protein
MITGLMERETRAVFPVYGLSGSDIPVVIQNTIPTSDEGLPTIHSEYSCRSGHHSTDWEAACERGFTIAATAKESAVSVREGLPGSGGGEKWK